MLNIALVDDESPALLLSKSAIEGFFREKGIAISLDAFSSSVSFVSNIKGKTYQLVFLDIDIPEINGIECAKKVKEADFNTTIIFLSQREDLVFECLTLHPFGFIRKSKIIEDFPKILDLYISTVYENEEKPLQLNLKSGNGLLSFRIPDIVYIEGNRNYQSIHHKNGEIQNIRISLNELEELLTPYGFIRVQKGFLVNYIFIRRIDSSGVTLINGSVLPISAKRKDEIMEAYLKITRNNQATFFN